MGGEHRRWLLVESQARQESDLKKLEKKIAQEKKTAGIAKGLSDSLKYHQLTEIQGNYFQPDSKKSQAKLTDNSPSKFYRIQAELELTLGLVGGSLPPTHSSRQVF
jgi:hypothetical protein